MTRQPHPSSLADVLDLILDKGLVIDAYVRISLVGIELLTVDARIVIASVDTYLHFAEAVNRLDLTPTETQGLPELMDTLRGDDSSSNGGRRNGQGGRKGRAQLSRGGNSGQQDQDSDEDQDSDDDGDRVRAQDTGDQDDDGQEADEQQEDEDAPQEGSLMGRLAERGRRR